MRRCDSGDPRDPRGLFPALFRGTNRGTKGDAADGVSAACGATRAHCPARCGVGLSAEMPLPAPYVYRCERAQRASRCPTDTPTSPTSPEPRWAEVSGRARAERADALGGCATDMNCEGSRQPAAGRRSQALAPPASSTGREGKRGRMRGMQWT